MVFFTVEFRKLEHTAKTMHVIKYMNHHRAIIVNVFIIRVMPFFMKVSSIGHAAQNVQPIFVHLWNKKDVATASTNGLLVLLKKIINDNLFAMNSMFIWFSLFIG